MSKDSIQQRMAAWMADYEDSGLLLETMGPTEVDDYLLDTAHDIMSQVLASFPRYATDYTPDAYTTGPLHRP